MNAEIDGEQSTNKTFNYVLIVYTLRFSPLVTLNPE